MEGLLAMFCISFLFCISLLFFWNRSLSSRIDNLVEQLKASEAELGVHEERLFLSRMKSMEESQ